MNKNKLLIYVIIILLSLPVTLKLITPKQVYAHDADEYTVTRQVPILNCLDNPIIIGWAKEGTVVLVTNTNDIYSNTSQGWILSDALAPYTGREYKGYKEASMFYQDYYGGIIDTSTIKEGMELIESKVVSIGPAALPVGATSTSIMYVQKWMAYGKEYCIAKDWSIKNFEIPEEGINLKAEGYRIHFDAYTPELIKDISTKALVLASDLDECVKVDAIYTYGYISDKMKEAIYNDNYRIYVSKARTGVPERTEGITVLKIVNSKYTPLDSPNEGNFGIYVSGEKIGSIRQALLHEVGHWFSHYASQGTGYERITKTAEWESIYREEVEGSAVSDYDKSTIDEYFAAMFSNYVLGKEMPPKAAAFIERELKRYDFID